MSTFTTLVANTQAAARLQGVKLNRKDARIMLQTAFSEMLLLLAQPDVSNLAIKGFGAFRAMDLPAGTFRNPATGESVAVGPRSTVRFKISSGAKAVLNAAATNVNQA